MLKKFINVAAVGYLSIIATKAIAVVPQDTQHTKTPGLFYIEGAVGGAFSNWSDSLSYIFPSPTSSQFTNLDAGFTFGGDVGYKFNRYFSIEAGAFSLPKVNYTIQSKTNTYTATDSGSISNWLIDLAGKVTLPVASISGLDMFGKFGMAYRAGNFTDNETFNGGATTLIRPSVFDILEPVVGSGLQYAINDSWAVNAQYLYVPYGILSTTILGPNQADHISIPAAQLLTGGISFTF